MNHEQQDKRIYTMAEERPEKAVFKMGIPVIMGMLFMVIYNLVIPILSDFYGMTISWQPPICLTR